MDVDAEELEVLSMASVMGVGRQDVERALLDSQGDWEYVLQVLALAILALLAPSSSDGRAVRLDETHCQPMVRR